jgi:hypothetical protein
MLGPFSEGRTEQPAAAGGILIVHANHAGLHTAPASQKFMEESKMGLVKSPVTPGEKVGTSHSFQTILGILQIACFGREDLEIRNFMGCELQCG